MSHGGHTKQMLLLDDQLTPKVDTCYLVLNEAQSGMDKMHGEIYRIYGARTKDSGMIHDIFGTLVMLFQSLWILIKARPDAIISCGTSSAVPISYLGKLMGKIVIFIEDWSRANDPSLSGKLLYPIADLFFVQWKKMKRLYPKAIYAGRFQ